MCSFACFFTIVLHFSLSPQLLWPEDPERKSLLRFLQQNSAKVYLKSFRFLIKTNNNKYFMRFRPTSFSQDPSYSDRLKLLVKLLVRLGFDSRRLVSYFRIRYIYFLLFRFSSKLPFFQGFPSLRVGPGDQSGLGKVTIFLSAAQTTD